MNLSIRRFGAARTFVALGAGLSCVALIGGCGSESVKRPVESKPIASATSADRSKRTPPRPTATVVADRSAIAESPPPRFEEIAERMGIRFEYERGETGAFWPVEPTGGGAGWLDFDLDGRIDLVLVGGAKLPVDPAARFLATRIFRNCGDGFEDVTESARFLSHDYGQGCASADFDNDGDADLFVSNYGRCALMRNNLDGTFTETTDAAGVSGGKWNAGACFADLDRDGAVDLYLTNYFHFTEQGYQSCRGPKGEPQYCGPSDSPSLPDFVYRGRGDGTFENISKVLGDPPPLGAGFGAVAADLDDDGWPDVYVANDAHANFLFHNLTGENPAGGIRFEEVGYEWGVAVSGDGLPQASMGLACGDIDRNGALDLAASHFIFEYSTVYLNGGHRDFVDATQRLGVAAETLSTLGWGMGFVDFDNDGWLDLAIINGHLNRIDGGSQPYEMKSHVFRNVGAGRMKEVASTAGPYFSTPGVGRGATFGDYDDDGWIDLAVVHHHRNAALLRNETEGTNRSVTLELIGTRSNRDAINARVRLWIRPTENNQEETELVREIVSGDSYLSSNDRRLCIGIGAARAVARGEIRWPSGFVQTFGALPAGTRWLLVEGAEPIAQNRIRSESKGSRTAG